MPVLRGRRSVILGASTLSFPTCGTALSQRWNAKPAGFVVGLLRMLENQAVARFQAAGTGPAMRHTGFQPEYVGKYEPTI